MSNIFEEIKEKVEGVVEEVKEEISGVESKLDADGDGKLEASDIASDLHVDEIKEKAEGVVEDVKDKADVNNDGKIGFDDAVAAVKGTAPAADDAADVQE